MRRSPLDEGSYTGDAAKEAVRLAREIVEYVGDLLSRQPPPDAS